jgi:hypothetical protein
MVSDPLIGPLADNGGSTQTMALLPDSPAIDAGDGAQDAWKLFDTSVPPFINHLTQLAPGFGYCVRVSEDHTWIVDYSAS